MRSLFVLGVAIASTIAIAAQPQLTLDHAALAHRIVQQLDIQRGERVLSLALPGAFEAIRPHVRYEVLRAGGIDLGVVEVMAEPVPESLDPAVLADGARKARPYYKAMLRDVDAAIMLPGATPAHPAYQA